ncbi:hypothetical protein [Micromonospora sp. WMMD998]|uniref:hypothetical protein n=1 Tax=Micromonospora sp. WMMD998 TaxID=3016092 RepID=UPI00249A15CA|nr:hypothetical protein [Micromonospora sp. WMMD998]WFE41925.1 hypothetical protein O7619_27155 [Micromonospora sp. WMMD998]
MTAPIPPHVTASVDQARAELAEAEAEAEPVDEPEPEPEPVVVADPAAQAEHAEQVAAVDEQLAQPGPDDALAEQIEETQQVATELAQERTETQRLTEELATMTEAAADHRRTAGVALSERNRAVERVAELERQVEALTAERDEERERARDAGHAAKAAREAVLDLRRALAEQEQHSARELGARSAEIAQLRAELDRATAARRRVQRRYDDAVRTGLASALRVVWRYNAEQCEECGFRTTVPGMNHPHPMRPVTVLVVERDTAGASAPVTEPSKEK